MDGFFNTNIETQTIYEIYRGCRLCGAGAGYKMPIIQNVVHLDGAEVELKQKIRECVQIEVDPDDKMPPLICELCVDKVNDFYEFQEMCKQTNKRTRFRLGLPPQTMPRGAPDAGDCILGITEPVFLNEDSNEPLSRSKGKNVKTQKIKKEITKNKTSKAPAKTMPKTLRKESRESLNTGRSLRSKQPSPPRLRGTKRSCEDDDNLTKVQKTKRTHESMPRSILKKEKDVKEDNKSLSSLRLTRQKEQETSSKKVKIDIKPTAGRTTRLPPNKIKPPGPQLPAHKCKVCKVHFDTQRALSNHMRSHSNNKSADKKPVKKEPIEVNCPTCQKAFSSRGLLNLHKCPQRGMCNKCGRRFSLANLKRHQSTCRPQQKEVYIDPKIRRILKLLQIRVSRCDSLLETEKGGHYDVSNVKKDFGLDKTCLYPYMNRRPFKFEPGYMVNINDDIKDAFDADKYVHWDSDDTDSDLELTDKRNVDSLTALTLKTIFSTKFLGKVPKKRRKVKAENAFDSILNVSNEFDSDLKLGIEDIIESLSDEDDKNDKTGDSDSLFGDKNVQAVTNDDFDLLFASDKSLSAPNKETPESDLTKDNSKIPNEESSSKNEELNKDIVDSENSETVTVSKPLDSEVKVPCTDDAKVNNDIHNADSISAAVNENEVNNTQNIETLKDKDSDINEAPKDTNKSEEIIKDNIENHEHKDNDLNELSKDTNKVEEDVENHEDKDSDASKVSKDTNTSEEVKSDTTLENKANDNENLIPKESEENVSSEINNESEKTDGVGKDESCNGANEIYDKLINMDDLEDLDDDFDDDNKVIEELNAQRGEKEIHAKIDVSEKEKITMEELVPISAKASDLESISDGEFSLND